jgi:SOS-response transcriptional repressor LexA
MPADRHPNHLSLVSPDDAGDALVRALGAYLDRVDDESLHDDARYADWLARDARACESAAEREATECAAVEFAERARIRILAERARETVPVISLRVYDASDTSDAGAPSDATVDRAVRRASFVPWLETVGVAAGVGRDLWDEPPERWVHVPGATATGRVVAITVHGDSMLPVLRPRDVVAIHVGARPVVGAMIVARNGDDGYVVKRVRRVGRQFLELESFNPAYAPFRLAREPHAVVGVVTHVLRDE